MVFIKPIPVLPALIQQPAVVQELDRIRFSLDEGDYDEFCWFAREYPRVYRYHLYHAAYRLRSMHDAYQKLHEYFAALLESESEGTFEVAIGRGETWQVYWDFEAYLNALNASLDVLTRIVGLFYADSQPISFNRFCAKQELSGVVELLRAARHRWVSRMKDYRDCFVHYTPVDNETFVSCIRYMNGWEVRSKLPTNPNVRENIGFRYSRRRELLRYAVATYKNVKTLDKRVGSAIQRAYLDGQFPARTENLFFVGQRRR